MGPFQGQEGPCARDLEPAVRVVPNGPCAGPVQGLRHLVEVAHRDEGHDLVLGPGGVLHEVPDRLGIHQADALGQGVVDTAGNGVQAGVDGVYGDARADQVIDHGGRPCGRDPLEAIPDDRVVGHDQIGPQPPGLRGHGRGRVDGHQHPPGLGPGVSHQKPHIVPGLGQGLGQKPLQGCSDVSDLHGHNPVRTCRRISTA